MLRDVAAPNGIVQERQMRISTVVLMLAASGFIAGAVPAGIITVEKDGSGDFTSINSALIEALYQGSEVHVGPGTYSESGGYNLAIRIPGGLRLVSTDGPSVTIIDGGMVRTGVGFMAGLPPVDDATISGFTIRNGRRSMGGGLIVDGHTVLVENCIFESNLANQIGGAAYVYNGADVSFVDCTFIGNSAQSSLYGAIFASGATMELASCHACDNGPNAMSSGVTWDWSSTIWELCNDCNDNGIDDDIDGETGALTDIDGNGLWDSCEGDCNGNGVADAHECAVGYSSDVNGNFIPDECEPDCDGDGLPDDYELEIGLDQDCNDNGIADACDIADGLVEDCNLDGMPDECQSAWEDCDGNGIHDGCDIQEGGDCNENEILDACEILDGDEDDLDGNEILDACECLADIDDTGYVYLDEVVIWMHFMGNEGGPADVDHSGLVDIRDLIYILSHWGACPNS
jgi:hypothetical protein